MQGPRLRKYGVEATIDFDMFEIDGIDFRVDAVHVSGDTKIMKNEGAEANTTNGFTDEGQGYSIVLTATEMQAARIKVYFVDTATKVWLDFSITIETFGHASAQHALDLDTSIEDQVWDALLTGASHNTATSAGRRLRQLSSNVYSDGTAQTGGVNTITLAAGDSAVNDIYRQSYVAIIGGTGAGQGHHILTYNGTSKVAVIDDDWVTQPDATSEYIIFGAGSHDGYAEGLAQAGAVGSITLQSIADTGTDRYKDAYITVLSGTGAHQSRRITGYNGSTKVATVSPNWVVNPDATSGYIITPQADAVEISKAVWDRVLSKTNHNIGQSGGKMLRELGVLISAEGAVSGTPTTTVFTTNITGFDDDFFKDQVVSAYNGAAMAGQGRVVSAYNGTTGVFTVDEPFTTALSSGDDVVVFTPHVHPVTQIADAVLDEALAGHTTAGSLGQAIADIEIDTDDLQGNQGSWLTATGFSTHSAAAVWSVGTRALSSSGNSAVAASVLTTTIAERTSGQPSATPTLESAISYLYGQAVFGGSASGSQKSHFNSSGSTIYKQVLSDNGTYTEARSVAP